MLTIASVINNFKFILGSTLFAHLQNQHSLFSNFYIFRLQPFQNETQNERLYIVITWLVKANHSISIQQYSKFNLGTTIFHHLQNQHFYFQASAFATQNSNKRFYNVIFWINQTVLGKLGLFIVSTTETGLS